MGYMVDTGDIKEGGTSKFELVPEGIHDVEIIEKAEKLSKNQDPMINLKMQITSGHCAGQFIWDNIIIPKLTSPAIKIMGRTMHFLHVIGEPYEGKFVASPEKWIYKKFSVKVKHQLQKEGKYAGQMKATVSEYILPEDVVTVDDGSGAGLFE